MSNMINMLGGINRLNLAKKGISVPETQKQNIQKQTKNRLLKKKKQTINELCNNLNWPIMHVFEVTNTGKREEETKNFQKK